MTVPARVPLERSCLCSANSLRLRHLRTGFAIDRSRCSILENWIGSASNRREASSSLAPMRESWRCSVDIPEPHQLDQIQQRAVFFIMKRAKKCGAQRAAIVGRMPRAPTKACQSRRLARWRAWAPVRPECRRPQRPLASSANWQLDRISAVAPKHVLCVRRRDRARIRPRTSHRRRLPPPRCITTARPPTVVLIILNFGVRLRLSPKGQQSSSLLLQTLQLHTPQFM
ncbi:hypothetical protein PD5205_03534 [Xanthomonas fragariae]|uniref:Uncharacterized protein n=1 Tax=Xanthomonas fragariae TaxID=48664 RepID=A0A1Y6HMS2_9XANT|nr:hypothetical protein PD885_00461 [Xanthomonas fragariae]SMR04809.1 hypothetical protein PD5205_03534 [Xanthomonas fragariae]